MQPKFEIKRQLLQRTDRVKGVDLHPSEPWRVSDVIWVLRIAQLKPIYMPQAAGESLQREHLYLEHVRSGAYQSLAKSHETASPNAVHAVSQSLVKSFEVCELPVRTAKFVARKQWVITGADDMLIRVYNYNTMDKVKVFEAHTDYIR